MAYWNPGDEITADKLNKGHAIQSFTYGETIAVNDALYLKSDGKVYKTNATYADERVFNFIGFAKESGNTDDVKTVQISGIVDGFDGLTPAGVYYLSETPGAITLSPSGHRIIIGRAVSPTKLFIEQHPALVATIPSDHIKFANDTQVNLGTSSYDWKKIKEIKVNVPKLEEVRVSFVAHRGLSGANVYMYVKIYKNGVAIGESYNPADYSYNTVEVKEDHGPFVKGDLIQIYEKQGGDISSSSSYIKNFRLGYDEVYTRLVDFTSQDP